MIKIIPFEVEHALNILVRPEQYDEQHAAAIEKWAIINKEGGPGYSGFHEDTLLACVGIRLMWQGVGEAWALFSQAIVDFKKEAYVIAGAEMERLIYENNLTRIQAHADATFPLSYKYLEGLGFKRECLMRKFQPNGNDSFLYSMVR